MLTATAAKQAPPKDKPYRLYDEKGLYLEVRPNGSKYWRLKYRFAGKEKRLALGVYPEVTLKRAREKQLDARRLLSDGEDPAERKHLEKLRQKILAGDTFGAIGQEWFAKEKRHWSESHSSRVERLLTKDLAPLSRRPITDVTAPELLQALRKIEARGAIETAVRTKQIAGQVFRYAVATGRAERDPSRDLQGALAKPVKRHLAAITDPKLVGPLLRDLYGYKGTPTVRSALQLAPILFVRPGELRRMEWSELDLDDGLWVIPGSKTKRNRDHLVPLAVQAIDILRDLEPLTGHFQWVFPSGHGPRRPMSENAVLVAMRKLEIPKETMTGHGFRAMARTILDEVLEYRVDVIEHQLGHAVRDTNGEAYNRTKFLNQRREMMQAWADYLDDLRKGDE